MNDLSNNLLEPSLRKLWITKKLAIVPRVGICTAVMVTLFCTSRGIVTCE